MHASRLGFAPCVSLVVAWAALLAFFWTGPICAQTDDPPNDQLPAGARDIRFDHLTTKQGLSNNIVWDILQDSRGFMWFATIDGLNRYDGYETKVYRHDPDDADSLSTNPLRVILEDRTGDLWIGTSGAGLNRFDRETERFTHYQHNPDDPDTLSGNDVRSIYEDLSGALWIGTTAGLNRLVRNKTEGADPESENELEARFDHFKHDPGDPKSLSHDFVQSVIQDREGMIWIGTWGGGLDRLDPRTGDGQVARFTHYRHDPDNPSSLSNDFVWVVAEDETGTIWAGTNGGLNSLERESAREDQARFVRYRHDPSDPSSLSDDTIRSVSEDQAGNLWVGTFGGGLNLLDRQAGSFVRYQHNPADSYSLSDNGVISIQGDWVGTLWIGTAGGGVSAIDASRKPFAHFRYHPSDLHGLSGKAVRSIHEDQSGVLWIGTQEGGLNRFDPEEGTFAHYRHDPDDPHSLSDNFVWSIAEDPQGVLWIGTEAGGLNRFNPQSVSQHSTGHFDHYRHDPADPKSVGSNSIRSVLVDKSGDIWLGTRGNGLERFDPETETFTHYLHDADDPHSLSNNAVRVLYEDSGGNLWIGTIGGGLDRFDRVTETFVHLQHDPSDSSSLSDNSVRAILEDHAGTLWIGTWGGGLNELDRTEGTFKRYSEADGLASNVIWGMLEDNVPPEAGGPSLWISTNQGLSRFNLETETFRNYDSADGLQSNSFFSAQDKGRGGVLYFGGVNGFNAFNPAELQDNPHPPPVVLVDLHLNNRPVPIGGESVLRKSIVEADDLVLSHEDRVITFRFAALNFSSPEKNRYRYMLEGFDDTWAEIGSDSRLATYTNLDPGRYVFRVLGSNNDGVWNEEGTAIQLTITPPWWATWWFRGLALLLLVVLAFAAYTWRTRSLRTRQRELEAEVEDRRVAEQALAGQLAFERLLADLSTTFVNLPPEQLNQSIQEALAALAHHLSQWGPHPRSCSLIIHRQDLDRFVVTHHSTEVPGLPPPGSVLDDIVPWFAERWHRGETVAIRRLHDIPEEASAEREICIRAGIRAVLFATFSVAGGPAGTLAVNDVEEEAVWDERTVQSIRLVGEMLGNALERQRVAEEIRISELRYREQLENQVAERTAELETLLDLSGSVASTLELDPLLDLILDGLGRVVDYDGAVIRRLSGDRMELLAHRLTYEGVSEPARYLPVAGVSVLEEMVERGTALNIGDIDESSGLVEGLAAEGDARMERLLSKTHSWLGVPLVVKGDVIGMLSVVHGQPHYYDQEAVTLTQALANQVAIAIENAQLYAKAQETATLEERTRLARDLHDSATQALYSALLFSETGKKLGTAGDLEGAEYYQDRVSEVVQQALKEMRLLVYELRPPELEAEGLVGALQMRLDAVESRVGMEARLRADALPTLSPVVTEHLYRVALEALNNVLKHAQADTVTVLLRSEDNIVLLEVSDDGLGFDPEVAQGSGGLGLLGIQERVDGIEGMLTIRSRPGQGTSLKVSVEVPS